MAHQTRPLEKPAIKAKAIGYIIEGLSDAEVAAALSDKRVTVTRQAITQFRHRHAAEIAPVVEQVEKQITDFAIANKVNRIADYDELRIRLREEIEVNGVAWNEATRYGSKRHISAAVTELRAVNKQAAEELDQLPRAGIVVNNQNVVIVKQVSGSDAALD